MPTARARLAPLLLVLATGSLAACGSSGSSAPQTPSYPTSTVDLNGPAAGSSTSAYAGSTVSKDKSFSTVLPVGWKAVKSSVSGVVIFVQAPTATHGVRTNFSVLRQAAPGVALADMVGQSQASLQQSGYAVTAASPTTVGGIKGEGLTATKTVQGKPVSERQYFVQHGSAVYITTMTSSAADAAGAAAAQTAIFGSWAWSRS
ncbi:DcrB-related protein [Allobranchiibius sp. CTAmp26]|uniref:DcrB-related protein n=1 Tax=Allobranchiibius sp. CTAmp26 TaxID=2815214 RepID=UPI001AA1CA88|nr:DcrB-related protein [Allobranchiibius sp. CTAmp26]MBO1754242.1 DcrB-related protein [Allobranchiibius sp. CTAmp26]